MIVNTILICCIVFLCIRVGDLQRQINKTTKYELWDYVYVLDSMKTRMYAFSEEVEVDYYYSSWAKIIDKKDDYILVAIENDDSETIKKFNIKDKNIKFFSTREAANYAADIKNNIVKLETLLDVIKFKNKL